MNQSQVELGIIRAKHLKSLDRMLAEYREGAKSAHWQMFYTDEMAALLRGDAISAFRSNSLKDDLEDRAAWFKTADAYKRLSSITGVDWIDRFSETSIGKPETHEIDGRRISYHELVLCEYLWKIDQAIRRS